MKFDWTTIYRHNAPKLIGVCRRYVKEVAIAEDIVQDSFIVAIQKQDSLKNQSALEGWLCRIVINMAIHYLKNEKKQSFIQENYDIADNETIMNQLDLDQKSALLSSDIDRNDILEAIDSLPEHHKMVFNLYVFDQFSHAKISDMLQISVGTSKSNLSRARKSIQTFLYEKLNLSKADDKKKKRFALLLLLGFGNQLFAKKLRKPFTDFEIQPTKPINLSEKPFSQPHQFVGLVQSGFSKIGFIALGSIIIVVATFLFFQNKATNYNENTPVEKYKENLIITNDLEPKTENKNTIGNFSDDISTTKNNDLQPKTDTLSKTENAKATEKTTPISTKKIAQPSTENLVHRKKQHQKNIKKLDTLPKKVVVIKKIIKRDTIYVQK